MAQHETVRTSLADAVRQDISASLAAVDAELARRYPGDPGTRQPVHTVYVAADAFGADTVRSWGDRALAALDEHAPDAERLAAVLGLPRELAAPVHDRVRAKLRHEPVEDLRIDFEDGYGHRPDAEEDAAAAGAARVVAGAVADGTAPPYVGIRMKGMEAAVRDRGIRTLDVFLTGLLEAGGLPGGLVLTLPKVTFPQQVTAFVRLAEEFEKCARTAGGTPELRGAGGDPAAHPGPRRHRPVARLTHAVPGRITGLHYGTYDYSASLQISADTSPWNIPSRTTPRKSCSSPPAGTGIRLSDGSTNVFPVGAARGTQAWQLHCRLVRRSLERGYYQGWDLHPAQLPSRFAATYAFYRQGLPAAAARLRNYVDQTAGGVIWTNPPPHGPWQPSCCADSTAGRWTTPRSRPPRD